MTRTREFSQKVESFCEKTHEHEYGRVSPTAEGLCDALRSCSGKIGSSDLAAWERKLDAVSSAYDACDQSGGIQVTCNPFVDKAERMKEACLQL